MIENLRLTSIWGCCFICKHYAGLCWQSPA